MYLFETEKKEKTKGKIEKKRKQKDEIR